MGSEVLGRKSKKYFDEGSSQLTNVLWASPMLTLVCADACRLSWLSWLWQSFGGASSSARRDSGRFGERFWRGFAECMCFAAETFCQLLLKSPSCVYFWSEEEGKREVSSSGIFIAMQSGGGHRLCITGTPQFLLGFKKRTKAVSPVRGFFSLDKHLIIVPLCSWWINGEKYRR